jgi:integrase/recombinase XerD
MVIFGDRAARFIGEYLKRARPLLLRGGKSDRIFLSRAGPIDRKSVYKNLKGAALRAGVSGAKVHTLRHSFATHLLENGAGILDVKELLGHESVTTTEIYTHVAQPALKATHAKYHPRG